MVILVSFLPGGDLINAEKQTGCAVRSRGCCGVRRTVALRTHPPVGRKRSCGEKANRGRGRVSLTPLWTRDLTFRLLPITSARHLAHIPHSDHAHVALYRAHCEEGVGGAVHGGVKRMKTTVFTGQLQEDMDAGEPAHPPLTGWGNIMLQHLGLLVKEKAMLAYI